MRPDRPPKGEPGRIADAVVPQSVSQRGADIRRLLRAHAAIVPD